MTPLDEIDIPVSLIQLLKDSGIKSVEELCAKKVSEIRRLEGIGDLNDVKSIRKALGKLGLDLWGQFDDPVGMPDFPSRVALRNFYAHLCLMPRTRKTLTAYLHGAITDGELLAQSDPDDHETVTRLLQLFNDLHPR